MIEWLTIISLLTVGIILVIAEIIFVPGTTIVGILGMAFMIAGVYFGFEYFGSSVGMAVLGGAVILTAVAMYISFKSKAWERFSLKGANKGKVNEGLSNKLSIGEQGLCTSTLKPVGKVEFGNIEYEVTSMGGFVEVGKEVEIIKIDKNKIVVEPIK